MKGKEYVDEFANLSRALTAEHKSLIVKFGWPEVFTVLSLVQLALRHPGVQGEIHASGREFVNGIIALVEVEQPRLAELLRLGDDPEYDLERL